MKRIWVKSKCPICGKEYEHLIDYKPKTCGRFECLREVHKRGMLR